MKYQAVFTVTNPDQYKNWTFIGGYGGATAIVPTINVVTVEARNDEDLQIQLRNKASVIASNWNPKYIVQLVSVIPHDSD